MEASSRTRSTLSRSRTSFHEALRRCLILSKKIDLAGQIRLNLQPPGHHGNKPSRLNHTVGGLGSMHAGSRISFGGSKDPDSRGFMLPKSIV